MPIYIALFLGLSAAADSSVAIKEAVPGCVIFEMEKKIRDNDPLGWRYDFWEYHRMLKGDPRPPEYYKDPVHGNNHGVATA